MFDVGAMESQGWGAVASRAVWAGPGAIHCLDTTLCHLPNPLKKLKKLKKFKKLKKSKVHPGPMCVQTGASDRCRVEGARRFRGGVWVI